MAEKTVLSEKIQDTSNKLERASKLTTGLADEQVFICLFIKIFYFIFKSRIQYLFIGKVRWQDSMQQLDARLANIVGNTFLSAGCIAYLGAFTR
jgi:dynein heavy chain